MKREEIRKQTVILLLCILFPSLSSHAQNDSRVDSGFFFSKALGVPKFYRVYLPAGYDTSTAHYPVVFFLRLHESEWFNPDLPGRSGTTLKDVADTLIATGQIGEMIFEQELF